MKGMNSWTDIDGRKRREINRRRDECAAKGEWERVKGKN